MDESRSLITMLVAVVFFIVSIFMCFGELRYAVFGAQIDARVVQKVELKQKNSRRRAARDMLEVTYSFADGSGPERKEKDLVGADWTFKDEGSVAVQYIPGSPGSSRLAGHDGKFWIVIMLVCMAVCGFFGWRFWKFYKS